MKNSQAMKSGRPVKSGKKPAFSWCWVYMIILLYVILAPFWSGSYNVKETTWQQISTTVLSRKAVDRLEAVNKEKVNVYLKSAFAKDPAFKEVFTPAFGEGISAGPHYTFTIGSIESFEHNLTEVEKNFAANEKVPVSYSYQNNWLLMSSAGWRRLSRYSLSGIL